MGLVKHLLFWPVTLPKAIVEFSLRQVEGVVHKELTDDDRVKEDLMALQMELEIGDIDEETYLKREAALMERLRDTRAWRTRLGMEEEWAPLGLPRRAETGGTEPQGGREEWPPGSSTDSPPGSSSS